LAEASAIDPTAPDAVARACTIGESALDNPNVFLFGELLQIPIIAELGTDNDIRGSTVHSALVAFSSGTRGSLEKQQLNFLNDVRIRKLQMLTMCRYLSTQGMRVALSDLKNNIFPTVQGLVEEVIFDALESQLIEAQLDHETDCLLVTWVCCGDVADHQIPELLEIVRCWKTRTENTLQRVNQEVENKLEEAEKTRLAAAEADKKKDLRVPVQAAK